MIEKILRSVAHETNIAPCISSSLNLAMKYENHNYLYHMQGFKYELIKLIKVLIFHNTLF